MKRIQEDNEVSRSETTKKEPKEIEITEEQFSELWPFTEGKRD